MKSVKETAINRLESANKSFWWKLFEVNMKALAELSLDVWEQFITTSAPSLWSLLAESLCNQGSSVRELNLGTKFTSFNVAFNNKEIFHPLYLLREFVLRAKSAYGASTVEREAKSCSALEISRFHLLFLVASKVSSRVKEFLCSVAPFSEQNS